MKEVVGYQLHVILTVQCMQGDDQDAPNMHDFCAHYSVRCMMTIFSMSCALRRVSSFIPGNDVGHPTELTGTVTVLSQRKRCRDTHSKIP